jgi:DNA polymerase (family X)
MMDKTDVARVLREMSYLLRTAKASIYQARAYERAADQLLQVRAPLEELVHKGKLRDIPGVGRSLEQAITELVYTGRLNSHERLRSEYSPFVGQLAELPGVGPKKALTLWRSLKVESFEALEQAIHDGRLDHVRGFGRKTQALLLSGLTSRVEPQPRKHRLVEGLAAARLLIAELRSNALVERAELAGAARRYCETIEGVELLVASSRPEAVLDDFVHSGQVFETAERTKNSVTVRLYRPALAVRLSVCEPQDFIGRWVVETGSPSHIEDLRTQALERQLDLNLEGLHRGAEKLFFNDESSFYGALGCSYVPPELREGSGEMAAASSGKIPTLIERVDILGVVHSHSTWSDGNASLEQMANAARERGYRYLTVTDHSPTAFYAGGLTVDELRRQWDEIDALNERLSGFKLLKGTESDITATGTLDYPDQILENLDVVIGSVHARYKMDEERMTRRILAALDSPHLHVLGHLTGRLLTSRPAYGLRVDEVFEKAARNGVAIEVNGSPYRLDIDASLVRRALDAGVKLVVSADAHSIKELDNVGFAVGTARKGWATSTNVLNTLSSEAFCQTLRGMRTQNP